MGRRKVNESVQRGGGGDSKSDATPVASPVAADATPVQQVMRDQQQELHRLRQMQPVELIHFTHVCGLWPKARQQGGVPATRVHTTPTAATRTITSAQMTASKPDEHATLATSSTSDTQPVQHQARTHAS